MCVVWALALGFVLRVAAPALAGCDTTTTTTLVPCEATPVATCDGACAGDGVCAPDIGSFSSCVCYDPSQPCGQTYAVCNGVCPPGLSCRPTGVIPFGACTCEPAGTLCSDGPFPTCSGACPGSQGCFPTRGPFLGGTLDLCSCGGVGACGAGGLSCPPGFVCTVVPPSSYFCLPL